MVHSFRTSNRRGMWSSGYRNFKSSNWHEAICQLVLTQTRYVEFDVLAGKLRVLDEPYDDVVNVACAGIGPAYLQPCANLHVRLASARPAI